MKGKKISLLLNLLTLLSLREAALKLDINHLHLIYFINLFSFENSQLDEDLYLCQS